MADKVVVVLREFVTAASFLPKMTKRPPRGSFATKRPSDTLLYSAEGRLVVSTPVKVTPVGMVGAWIPCVSTDAIRLAQVCGKLKADDFLMLTFAEGFIVLNDGAFHVPGKLVERPDGE
jgi:hypothetical protein